MSSHIEEQVTQPRIEIFPSSGRLGHSRAKYAAGVGLRWKHTIHRAKDGRRHKLHHELLVIQSQTARLLLT